MKQFFENNIWTSGIILGLFILVVLIIYFFRVKNTMKIIDENNPSANVWKNNFGNNFGAILQVLLMFVVFPLVAYFLIRFFSVEPQVEKQDSINFLTQTTEKISLFFENISDNLQSTPQIGGLVISGIGVIMLIAVLLNANWILDTRGHSSWFNTFLEMVSRKTARILMGILCVMLIISGILISLYS